MPPIVRSGAFSPRLFGALPGALACDVVVIEMRGYRQALAWHKWPSRKHGARQAPPALGFWVLHHRGGGGWMDDGSG